MSVLSDIRQRAPKLRVRAALICAADRDQLPLPVRFGRSLAVAATLAAFIAVSGAFGTGAISPGVRLGVLECAALAAVLGEFALAGALDRLAWAKSRPTLRFGAMSVMLLAGGILFCWGLAVLMEGSHAPNIARFALPAIVCLAMGMGVAVLVKPATAAKPQSGNDRPEFMARLPHRLRGATIVAVQGEDHYIRIHTSNGDHMLLMRLGDALQQLTVLDGAQTHRSWWVARSEVTDVKRGSGRAALMLANGVEAPVSRRFSRQLRSRGWY